MKTPEVIAGVARVPHDAIEDFVRRAEEYLEGKAKSGDNFRAIALLDDAVVNLRQLLAEYALVRDQRAARPEDTRPGSSAGIHCHHEGCGETLSLARTTAVKPTHEDDWRNFMPALYEAAVFLGWRVFQSVWWCPTHVVAKRLACSRCLAACPSCSCMGGPRSDAVDGDED